MIILASASPRRQQLLTKICPHFRICVPDVDEHLQVSSPALLPVELSKVKAYAIARDHPQDTIIACDTIVLLAGKVLGKPRDAEEATQMLRSLSGKKHEVITGYTIISPQREITRQIKTNVYFRPLSDELIAQYVATGSPLDKAGGYGIQDEDFPLIDHIEGSYDNVMGFPSEAIRRDL